MTMNKGMKGLFVPAVPARCRGVSAAGIPGKHSLEKRPVNRMLPAKPGHIGGLTAMHENHYIAVPEAGQSPLEVLAVKIPGSARDEASGVREFPSVVLENSLRASEDRPAPFERIPAGWEGTEGKKSGFERWMKH